MSEVPPAPSHSSAPHAHDVRSRETAIALRNGLKMGASLIVTWSVALIVKLQVPAHLGPVRQGHFGFAESFAIMCLTFVGLGIDTYLAKEVSVRIEHASEVVGGVFALRIALAAVALVVMAAFLWMTGRSPEIIYTAVIFGMVNLANMLNGTLGVVLNTTPRVGAAAISNMLGKTVWGVGLLIGLHFDAPLVLLALPGLLGEMVRIAIMIPANRREAGLRFHIRPKIVAKAIVSSVSYFVNGVALAVLGSLGMSVLEYIRHDEREVGWFACSQNIAYLCSLLTPIIGWVVMPMTSRAFARSREEGLIVLRRVVEALLVAIVPLTVLMSAGADVLIHYAFGDKFAPAHTGLSILSLVFILTYIDTMLAISLTVMGKGWSVTFISIGAVLITAGLMFVFVPLGRAWIGEGGECAGAAASVIGSEVCVLFAMLTRFGEFPFDRRNLVSAAKTIGVGVATLVLNRQILWLGPSRLLVEAAFYLIVAVGIRAVRLDEVRVVLRLLRKRPA